MKIDIKKECTSKGSGIQTGIATLKHSDYLCPFCSHGETIEVHVESSKSTFSYGFDFKYSLSCLGSCMSYRVMDVRGAYRSDENDDKGINKAVEIFKKLVAFSKNFTDHHKNVDFIL